MRRLTDAKMTRSLVKKDIMTTPYGVKNHYMASYIIRDLSYSLDSSVISCDAARGWELYFKYSASPQIERLDDVIDPILIPIAGVIYVPVIPLGVSYGLLCLTVLMYKKYSQVKIVLSNIVVTVGNNNYVGLVDLNDFSGMRLRFFYMFDMGQFTGMYVHWSGTIIYVLVPIPRNTLNAGEALYIRQTAIRHTNTPYHSCFRASFLLPNAMYWRFFTLICNLKVYHGFLYDREELYPDMGNVTTFWYIHGPSYILLHDAVPV